METPSYAQGSDLSNNTYNTLQMIGCAVIGLQHLSSGCLNIGIIVLSLRFTEKFLNWQILVLNLCLINAILAISLAPTFLINLVSGRWATGEFGCVFSGFL